MDILGGFNPLRIDDVGDNTWVALSNEELEDCVKLDCSGRLCCKLLSVSISGLMEIVSIIVEAFACCEVLVTGFKAA